MLLVDGADIEAKSNNDFTPALFVISSNAVSCLQVLLANGIDIKANHFRGATLSHLAVRLYGVACLAVLLAQGADPLRLKDGDGAYQWRILLRRMKVGCKGEGYSH